MDFFTHCCKKLFERALRAWRLALLCWLGAHGLWAAAQTGVRIESLSLTATDPVVQLSAQLAFELPTPVDDALHRGVPLSFSAEATLFQERWYWVDKMVTKSQRYWRLSYQPLTRRYRLQVSQQPIDNTGLGVGLAQNHDTLSDALSALQRIGAWTIGEFPLPADAKHRLEFKFKLDSSPLLRPWLSSTSDNEWGLSAQRSMPIQVGGAP